MLKLSIFIKNQNQTFWSTRQNPNKPLQFIIRFSYTILFFTSLSANFLPYFNSFSTISSMFSLSINITFKSSLNWVLNSFPDCIQFTIIIFDLQTLVFELYYFVLFKKLLFSIIQYVFSCFQKTVKFFDFFLIYLKNYIPYKMACNKRF